MSLSIFVSVMAFATSVRICTSSCASKVPDSGVEVGSPKCTLMEKFWSWGEYSNYHAHPTCMQRFFTDPNPDELIKWGRHMPPGCITKHVIVGCALDQNITDVEAWQNATAAAIKEKMGCDEIYVSQPYEVSGGVKAMIIKGNDQVCCTDAEGKEKCGNEAVSQPPCEASTTNSVNSNYLRTTTKASSLSEVASSGGWTAGAGMAFAVMVLIGLFSPALV